MRSGIPPSGISGVFVPVDDDFVAVTEVLTVVEGSVVAVEDVVVVGVTVVAGSFDEVLCIRPPKCNRRFYFLLIP